MTAALHLVQAVVSLSFLALGLLTVVDWLRHRERSRRYLALAFMTLGLTGALSQVNTMTGYRLGALVGDLTLILFMTSGFALLLFRDSFIPLSGRLRVGALMVCVGATALALATMVPAAPPSKRIAALEQQVRTLQAQVKILQKDTRLLRATVDSNHEQAPALVT